MSVFDYLPHRLLLNRPLRKSADQLRMAVDSYQEKYERQAAAYEADIKETGFQLEKKYENVRASLEAELKTHESELANLLNDVSSYSDCFLLLKCLREKAKLQYEIVRINKESVLYLREQMHLIGKEVDLLRARRDELSSLVAVDDFIELSRLSCGDLRIEGREGCEELLSSIRSKLDDLPEGHPEERSALIRLRNIIQERADYLPLIQYVEWIIEQKIGFSKKLKRERDAVKIRWDDAKRALSDTQHGIDAAFKAQCTLAKKVRMHWTAPIARLDAEINHYSTQKDSAWEEMKHVEDEIKHMKEMHSPNQGRWSNLNERHDNLYRSYKQLKNRISERKASRNSLYKIQRFVFRLCQDNGVPLRGDGNKGKGDRWSYIKSRLDEINQVRSAGNAAAAEKCETEKQTVIRDRDARLEELSRQQDEANARVRELITEEKQLADELQKADEVLRARKDGDSRFLLFRLIDSKEVASAKKSLAVARARYSAIQRKKIAAECVRNSLQANIEEERKAFDEKLAGCQPHPLRPNAEELLEEKILKAYRQKLEMTQ